MERFYRHLAANEDKGSALRQAKLDLLGQFADRAAPFHWAGFVMEGDDSTPVWLLTP